MPKQYPSAMIDLETLAVSPDAQILSISAVAFDEFDLQPNHEEYPTLDILVELDEQQDRAIDPETVAWWSRRDPEVIDKIFAEEGRTKLDNALTQISKFLWQKQRIWCQGPTLDITVLEHVLRSRGMGIPWQYHIIRDSRTLLDLTKVEQPPVTHDSLVDCFRQLIGVQDALKKLGITQFVNFK